MKFRIFFATWAICVNFAFATTAVAKCKLIDISLSDESHGISENYFNKKIFSFPYAEENLSRIDRFTYYQDRLKVGLYDYKLFVKLSVSPNENFEVISASIHSPFSQRIRSFRCKNLSNVTRRRRR